MREIKFKALDSYQEVMIEWNELINRDKLSLWNLLNGLIDHIKPIQYTGLKDKNGKEIYESYVIIISEGSNDYINKPMKVVYNCGAFCMYIEGVDYENGYQPTSFTLYRDHCIKNGLEYDISKYIEVIGNIHQNPELLK